MYADIVLLYKQESVGNHISCCLIIIFLMQETKDATLKDRTMQAEFLKICEDLIRPSVHPVDCPKPLIRELFSEILSRVINTMMNSLLQCAAMVTRIRANKGVDADVALRDKLKVYAAEKESSIKL